MNMKVRQTIESLTKSCTTCFENAAKPQRFKFTVGTDDLRFNHIVAVDVMYINNRPLLHVIDEATQYASAMFLPTMKSKDVRKALLQC